MKRREQMSKPIVAFDLETTGLDRTKDQIIQIACIKFDRDTKKVLDRRMYYVQPVGSYQITIAAYKKHGIHPNFLKDKPYFKDIANEIYDFIKDCDILSFNGTTFDVPFLKFEFDKVGIDWNVLECKFYDAFAEEKRRNGNSLEATYERYYHKTMTESGLQAHDAFSDVMATIGVFYAQQNIEEYDSFTPLTEDNIIFEFEFEGKIVPCFSIGKYKNLPIDLVYAADRDYLNWCVNKSSFLPRTKEYIQNYLNKKDAEQDKTKTI